MVRTMQNQEMVFQNGLPVCKICGNLMHPAGSGESGKIFYRRYRCYLTKSGKGCGHTQLNYNEKIA